MHVAQLNFFPAPAQLAPAEVFEHWPSLADISELIASAGTRVSVVLAAARTAQVKRSDIDYYFVDVTGADTSAKRGEHYAEVLRAIKPDVLHVHGLGFAEDAHAVSQRMPQLPMLLQDHADRPPRWWRRARWRNCYASAAGVVFTARELAQPFVDLRMFTPTTRLFAIPESSNRFVPGDRARARAATGMHGEPCALWVGHLNHGKDPLTVLEGVAGAAERLPGLQLWCAFGDAPLLAEVQQRIAHDSRLAGRVHLLGKLPHTKIELSMQATDLFVAGSHAESCGYALMEALACGIAPVVTDIPSFRALTDDGRVGRLWPCGDAARLTESLLQMAANPPSRQQVRAHFEATLSFAAVGRQWAEAYAQVLDDRRRNAA